VSGGDEPDFVRFEADGLVVEIGIAAGADASLADVIASATGAANAIAGPAQGSITVLVDDDRRLQELNKTWRGQDKPTNVLSFPSPDAQVGPDRHFGDIVISHETAAREAANERKSLPDHIAHLSVHGFLHLLGYDHESDGDAARMEDLERTILARLGISDPYVAEGAGG
jgi:probable rRNA maturation factor